jgi:hypothetical protein
MWFSLGVATGIFLNLLIEHIFKNYNEKNRIITSRFPCDNCINFNTCKNGCELLEYDEVKLNKLFLKYKCCPDCGCPTLYEGPTGGLSVNVKCSKCGHYFNLGFPMFSQRISMDPNTKEFKKSW